MRVLVTGGGGFLGRYVVERCLERGHRVTSLARGAYPELEALGAETVRADLGEPRRVAEALRGHDGVVHAAALTGVWGRREDYFRANVEGTRNVLAACRAAGIGRLVHTGSPSSTFDGRDHRRVATDLPHARRFLSPYPESKARSERLVLDADGPELATCVLRPHLIFGPRDPHLIPRLVERGRQRKLAIVGDGTNEVSLAWVADAAAAHVTALEALEPGAPHAGQAYFIAQRDPVRLWEWINELFARLGLLPVSRQVSLRAAYTAGACLEVAWRLLRKQGEPPMTRFVALQLARSHSYDPAPAERDFGHRESVSLAAATDLLVEHLRRERRTATGRARGAAPGTVPDPIP